MKGIHIIKQTVNQVKVIILIIENIDTVIL